jgi:RNA polymerase sigma factor (TIGR02999 family)
VLPGDERDVGWTIRDHRPNPRLGRWRPDSVGAANPLAYNELRRIARRYMRNQRAGNTLQTTALVHEAYLHLMDAKNVPWRDRAHFSAASAQIMRRIIIDAARARTSLKGGGGAERVNHSTAVDLDEIPSPALGRSSELLTLDDALSRPGVDRRTQSKSSRTTVFRPTHRGGSRGSRLKP